MATATLHADARSSALGPALPCFVAAAIYVVVLAVGNNLLNDSDSWWHITVGQWIVVHGLPHTDPFSFTFAGKPWIAKEWLSQIVLSTAFRAGGWPAVVVISAASIALALGLFARFLQERLAPLPVIAFAAVAFMLVAPHAAARPHVLALPVMVAWIGGLVGAADRGKAPSYWLLPLMVLWANLHGGFTLGIFLVGAVGLDAIAGASPADRMRTTIGWVRFGLLALVAGCVTPYGPESMLAAWRVLNLGPAFAIIGEWQPANFVHLGGLEIAIVFGAGFALWRGFTLPPVRILILLGLLHMALSAERNSEVFGLLAPLFLMAPLARQFAPIRADAASNAFGGMQAAMTAALAVLMVPATVGLAAIGDYRPDPAMSPVAAVEALKAANAGPVLNDYNLGGYMIAAGVPTFIDGRTELFGGDFTARAYRAVSLADLNDFVAMLDSYRIGATLLSPSTPAVALLDRLPDWKRLYTDDDAVVHVRLPLRPTLP